MEALQRNRLELLAWFDVRGVLEHRHREQVLERANSDEIDKLRPAKEKGINIVSFVTDGAIDPRYFMSDRTATMTSPAKEPPTTTTLSIDLGKFRSSPAGSTRPPARTPSRRLPPTRRPCTTC